MWEMTGKPEFFLGPSHRHMAVVRRAPDPPEGLSGVLKKVGEQGFAVADPASGTVIANISISGYGQALPLSQDRTRKVCLLSASANRTFPSFSAPNGSNCPCS